MTIGHARLTDQDLAALFEPCRVGPRTAPNRLVAQAMEAGNAAPGGGLSRRALERYWRLAEGGWGIVNVEATSVCPAPLGSERGLVLSMETAPSFEKLAKGFKARAPEGLLILQLSHSGPQSSPLTGPTSVCPNPEPGLRYLSSQEVGQIVRDHVDTALLAEQLGFDGIDYKLCNGYTGTEILRPANTRDDRWGGSWENRKRFVVEGYQEIMSRLTTDTFVVGSRIHYYERRPGGCGTAGPTSLAFCPDEPHDLVRTLARLGAHYINITGGSSSLHSLPGLLPEERFANELLGERPIAEIVRQEELGMTVIGSGYTGLGPAAASIGARRIRAGHTDMIGYGRQTYVDPLYPQTLRKGEKSPFCTHCGTCVKMLSEKLDTGCVIFDAYHRRLWQSRGAKLS